MNVTQKEKQGNDNLFQMNSKWNVFWVGKRLLQFWSDVLAGSCVWFQTFKLMSLETRSRSEWGQDPCGRAGQEVLWSEEQERWTAERKKVRTYNLHSDHTSLVGLIYKIPSHFKRILSKCAGLNSRWHPVKKRALYKSDLHLELSWKVVIQLFFNPECYFFPADFS